MNTDRRPPAFRLPWDANTEFAGCRISELTDRDLRRLAADKTLSEYVRAGLHIEMGFRGIKRLDTVERLFHEMPG